MAVTFSDLTNNAWVLKDFDALIPYIVIQNSTSNDCFMFPFAYTEQDAVTYTSGELINFSLAEIAGCFDGISAHWGSTDEAPAYYISSAGEYEAVTGSVDVGTLDFGGDNAVTITLDTEEASYWTVIANSCYWESGMEFNFLPEFVNFTNTFTGIQFGSSGSNYTSSEGTGLIESVNFYDSEGILTSVTSTDENNYGLFRGFDIADELNLWTLNSIQLAINYCFLLANAYEAQKCYISSQGTVCGESPEDGFYLYASKNDANISYPTNSNLHGIEVDPTYTLDDSYSGGISVSTSSAYIMLSSATGDTGISIIYYYTLKTTGLSNCSLTSNDTESELSNGSYSSDAVVFSSINTVFTITADDGYILPTSITGVDYAELVSWETSSDRSTGTLTVKDPTNSVLVYIAAVIAEYSFSSIATTGCAYSTSSNTIPAASTSSSNYVLVTFTANDGYTLANVSSGDGISVWNCSWNIYSQSKSTLKLKVYKATADVQIIVTAEERAGTTIKIGASNCTYETTGYIIYEDSTSSSDYTTITWTADGYYYSLASTNVTLAGALDNDNIEYIEQSATTLTIHLFGGAADSSCTVSASATQIRYDITVSKDNIASYSLSDTTLTASSTSNSGYVTLSGITPNYGYSTTVSITGCSYTHDYTTSAGDSWKLYKATKDVVITLTGTRYFYDINYNVSDGCNYSDDAEGLAYVGDTITYITLTTVDDNYYINESNVEITNCTYSLYSNNTPYELVYEISNATDDVGVTVTVNNNTEYTITGDYSNISISSDYTDNDDNPIVYASFNGTSYDNTNYYTTITLTADDLYYVPESVTVDNAEYNYSRSDDKLTGILKIYSPTGDVTFYAYGEKYAYEPTIVVAGCTYTLDGDYVTTDSNSTNGYMILTLTTKSGYSFSDDSYLKISNCTYLLHSASSSERVYWLYAATNTPNILIAADYDTGYNLKPGSCKTKNQFLTPSGSYKKVWNSMTWSGYTAINGQNIWSDGSTIYYSNTSSSQRSLTTSTHTWSTKTWSGYTPTYGYNIWTDGTDVYFSNGTIQYKKSSSSAFTKITWGNYNPIQGGQYVWTDGIHIYYSYNAQQYKLVDSVWIPMTWSGLTSFTGNNVWSDGTNIYYSSSSTQYQLDTSTNKWSSVTWSGLTSFSASNIWADGANIYCTSSSDTNYKLDSSSKTWNSIAFENGSGISSPTITGYYIWTDGDSVYSSYGTNQLILAEHENVDLSNGRYEPLSSITESSNLEEGTYYVKFYYNGVLYDSIIIDDDSNGSYNIYFEVKTSTTSNRYIAYTPAYGSWVTKTIAVLEDQEISDVAYYALTMLTAYGGNVQYSGFTLNGTTISTINNKNINQITINGVTFDPVS